MAYLWLQVAKNEIRLWTSRFRNHRALLFVILAVFMGVYAFVIVPLIFNALSPLIYDFLIFLPPYFIFYVYSFALLYIFIWCLTYPLSTTLQDTSDLSGQLEILLSSPVKAQDILFGKFIGRLPIYLILLFAITPWLVNLFNIKTPLPIFGQILIYLVIFLIVILGMWLGTLLAAYMESKVRKSERSRDFGKAMSFIVIILTVGLMYVTIWIVISGMSDPTSPLYTALQFFPSSWGAFIIMSIFGYGYLVPIHVIFFIILLLGLTVAVLFLGYHGAGRFYNLEPFETGTQRIIGEKRFYRFFRRIGGVQLVSQLKQYSRKLENFSRIVYAVALSVIIIVFNSVMSGDFLDPGFFMMFSTLFYAMMIAGMLGTFVIIGSKETLWIYRKAPNGVKNFVKSVYLVNIIFPLVIGLIFSTTISIVFGFTFLEGLLSIGLSVAFVLSLMAIAIGIAFIFPTFEERGSKVAILMGGYWGLSMGIWMGGIFLNIFVLDFLGFYGMFIITLSLFAIVGYVLLKLGIKKLSSLE